MRLHHQNATPMQTINDARREDHDPRDAWSAGDGRSRASGTPRRLRLYHGGVAGLAPGETLLPPLITGACSCADYASDHSRADRVYVTTDADEAAVYAALAAPGGYGDVYEVEPLGELQPDPPDLAGTGSFATRAARILAIVRRRVPPEDAIARMRAFLRTLDAAPAEPSLLLRHTRTHR